MKFAVGRSAQVLIRAVCILVFPAVSAVASTGGVIEVVQPMVAGESSDIVLRSVSYEVDDYWGPGQAIGYTCKASSAVTPTGWRNHNIAYVCGVTSEVVWAPKPVGTELDSIGPFVDSLTVEIDIREARARLKAGLEFGGMRFGISDLERLTRATRAAVVENASRSRPRIKSLRVRVIGLGSSASEEVVAPVVRPREQSY